MKQNNRQTSPFGRSTKADNAGLSLLRPRLFEVIGDTYNYFNEIIHNILTISSDFLNRLTQKKFSHSKFTHAFISRSIMISIDFKLLRPYSYSPKVNYFFSY